MIATVKTNVLGLIPARGGSKGIPRKNLVPLAGQPLIAHSIAAGLRANKISRLIVSTEDPDIANVAKHHGAEVPFMRPAGLAGDNATALEVIKHTLDALESAEGWFADIVVYLQPTSPLRRSEHIDSAVSILIGQKADTVVSVMEVPHNMNPMSVLKLENGFLKSYSVDGGPLRRQDKPLLFARNGPAVLVVNRATVVELNTLYGPRTLPFLMKQEESLDIDTPFDLEMAAWLMSRRETPIK